MLGETMPARRRRTSLAIAGALLLSAAALAAAATPAAAAPQAKTNIINGYYPHPAQWPWMASIVPTSEPANSICGGAVVAPTRILTAAHCVDEYPSSRWQVVVSRRQASNTAVGESVPIARIVIHPLWKNTASGHDVAVVTLARAVSAPAATLATETEWGSAVTAMGWGHTDHAGNVDSDFLLATDLATWSDAQCQAAVGVNYIPAVNLCAGGAGSSVCHGDSGGPAMITPDGGVNWRLIGVSSWVAYGKCYTDYPSVFAWVSGPTLRPWILAAIAEPLPPPPPPVIPRAAMASSEAAGYLRYLVKKKTNGKIRSLATTCTRTGEASFSCKASFLAGGKFFKGRFNVSKYYGSNGVLYWTGTFTGRRPATGRKVRWSV